MSNSWYQIKAQANGEYEVVIYDEIGFWGITAKQFIDDFKKIPAEAKVVLRINSPGGDVFDSLAIHNVIKRHAGEVSGSIDGLAASGASIIAMAARPLSMPENSFMMIHNSSGLALGNADDLRDLADILSKIDSGLVATYVARSGQPPEKIAELLNNETWLTAKEAVDLGLADEVTEAIKIAANVNLNKFAKVPAALQDLTNYHVTIDDPKQQTIKIQVDATKPFDYPSPEEIAAEEKAKTDAIRAEAEKRARDILAVCTEAGVADAASGFLDRGLTAEEVKAKLADAPKIRARCAAARLPDRADKYIKAGMSVKEVADDLFDVLIARQGPEIDNKISPEAERRTTEKPKVATPAEIYALRNKRNK